MRNFADLFGIGTTELLIVLAIILLLFGGKKLPELFKSAGSSVRELRKGLNGDEDAKRNVSNSSAENR